MIRPSRPTLAMREASAILALAMLLAGLPLGAGVIVTAGRSTVPTCTLDICHPLPGIDRSLTTNLLARPAPAAPQLGEVEVARVAPFDLRVLNEFVSCPDPPPPKALA